MGKQFLKSSPVPGPAAKSTAGARILTLSRDRKRELESDTLVPSETPTQGYAQNRARQARQTDSQYARSASYQGQTTTLDDIPDDTILWGKKYMPPTTGQHQSSQATPNNTEDASRSFRSQTTRVGTEWVADGRTGPRSCTGTNQPMAADPSRPSKQRSSVTYRKNPLRTTLAQTSTAYPTAENNMHGHQRTQHVSGPDHDHIVDAAGFVQKSTRNRTDQSIAVNTPSATTIRTNAASSSLPVRAPNKYGPSGTPRRPVRSVEDFGTRMNPVNRVSQRQNTSATPRPGNIEVFAGMDSRQIPKSLYKATHNGTGVTSRMGLVKENETLSTIPAVVSRTDNHTYTTRRGTNVEPRADRGRLSGTVDRLKNTETSTARTSAGDTTAQPGKIAAVV
jgi:hypothetical protein